MDTGAVSLGVKRSGHEADHSPPSRAEVRDVGAISLFPHMSSWRDAQLNKHKDNFTLPYDDQKIRMRLAGHSWTFHIG
jgi:hypothetical protein